MRVTLTILIDVPDGDVMGTKECIAHQLEQYGLVRTKENLRLYADRAERAEREARRERDG